MFYFSDIVDENRQLLNDVTGTPRFSNELLTQFALEAVRKIHQLWPDSKIDSSMGISDLTGLYKYTVSSYMKDYDNIQGWDRYTYPTLFAKMYENDTGAITVFADAGDSSHVVVTSAAHGLSEGMTVTISGTTSYNGIFELSTITANTYEIVDTWVANDATGDWVNNTVRFYISEALRTADTAVAEVTRVESTGRKPVRALNSSGWAGSVGMLSAPATLTTWDVWADEKVIPLDEIYRTKMINYLLWKCFSIDSEDTADANIAITNKEEFLGDI